MRLGSSHPVPSQSCDAVQYLLDTDRAIHYLHGVERIVTYVDGRIAEGVGLSIASIAELYEGVIYSSDPHGSEAALRDLLIGVDVISIDDAICRVFATERGRVRSAGNLIGDFDLLIGATAIRHGLTLLTNNRRHFQRMDSLRIVSV